MMALYNDEEETEVPLPEYLRHVPRLLALAAANAIHATGPFGMISRQKAFMTMYASGERVDHVALVMQPQRDFIVHFHLTSLDNPITFTFPTLELALERLEEVCTMLRAVTVEMVNVAFYKEHVCYIRENFTMPFVHLIVLRNCTYPGLERGLETTKFLRVLTRNGKIQAIEYCEERLKNRVKKPVPVPKEPTWAADIMVQEDPIVPETVPLGRSSISVPLTQRNKSMKRKFADRL